jgi:hypothetical protein
MNSVLGDVSTGSGGSLTPIDVQTILENPVLTGNVVLPTTTTYNGTI